MKNLMQMPEIQALSTAERIQLAQDLWDSIVDEEDACPLTDAQKAELERRIAKYEKNPLEGSSWEEVKKRITGKG